MSSKPSKRRLEIVGGRQERNEREFSVAVFIVGQKYFFLAALRGAGNCPYLPYGSATADSRHKITNKQAIIFCNDKSKQVTMNKYFLALLFDRICTQ